MRKRKWIKIFFNFLFIGVEWFWRRNINCYCDDCYENNDRDVIGKVLYDVYLLDKIILYEYYYSLEDYKSFVEVYELFVVDVLEESIVIELYEIMDIEGDGFLFWGSFYWFRKLD